MPSIKHTHQYQLRPYGRHRKVYQCVLPNCTHFQLQHHLLIGKLSICNQCGSEFTLEKTDILRLKVRPRCRKCKDVKYMGGKRKPSEKKIQEQVIDDAIADIQRRLGLI